MKKILIVSLLLTLGLFGINKIYSYDNDCGVSYGNCKPGYYCDKNINKCVPNNSYCKNIYGYMAEMNSNGKCECQYGQTIVDGKCENLDNICRNKFGNNSKGNVGYGGFNENTCTCKEGYKFKDFNVSYLDPFKYSGVTCVSSGNKTTTQNIVETKIEKQENNSISMIDEDTLYSYQNSAEVLASFGIINFQSNKNDYKVEQNISRREISKIIINFSKKNLIPKCEGKFNDVSKNDWGCLYIETALEYGLISGNSKFRPNDKVSNIEALKMILNSKNFSVEKTNNWIDGYINKGIELGLFETLENINNYTTRGFIFEIIEKLLIETNTTNNKTLDLNNSGIKNIVDETQEDDIDLSEIFEEIFTNKNLLTSEKETINAANRLASLFVIDDYSKDIDKYEIYYIITKLELMKIAVNLSNFQLKTSCSGTFQDLKNDIENCKYAETALNAGLIEKTNLFEPNQLMTHKESLLLLGKVRGWDNLEQIKQSFSEFPNLNTLLDKYSKDDIPKGNVYFLADLFITLGASTVIEEDKEYEEVNLDELFGDLFK